MSDSLWPIVYPPRVGWDLLKQGSTSPSFVLQGSPLSDGARQTNYIPYQR